MCKLSLEVISDSGELFFCVMSKSNPLKINQLVNAALSPDFILKILQTLKFQGANPKWNTKIFRLILMNT